MNGRLWLFELILFVAFYVFVHARIGKVLSVDERREDPNTTISGRYSYQDITLTQIKIIHRYFDNITY